MPAFAGRWWNCRFYLTEVKTTRQLLYFCESSQKEIPLIGRRNIISIRLSYLFRVIVSLYLINFFTYKHLKTSRSKTWITYHCGFCFCLKIFPWSSLFLWLFCALVLQFGVPASLASLSCLFWSTFLAASDESFCPSQIIPWHYFISFNLSSFFV